MTYFNRAFSIIPVVPLLACAGFLFGIAPAAARDGAVLIDEFFIAGDDADQVEYEKEDAESSAGAKVMTLNPPESKTADGAAQPKEEGESARMNPVDDRPSADGTEHSDAQPNESRPAEPPVTMPPPLPEELIRLREEVRKTVGNCYRYRLDTENFTAADLLDVCLAYGCDAEIRDMSPEGKGEPVNAFVCLCWNLPSAGFELLRLDNRGQIIPRVGYGYQQYPGQFLAVLALARVSEEYPIRVGKTVGTVNDLVEYEKRSCREEMDLSMKLIGLFRYVADDEPWKNDLGETWSKERLIEEELNRAQMRLPNGGLNHLIGLSYALDRRSRRDKPMTGEYARAKRYIQEYITYAVKLQDADGSWHPDFFEYQGKGGSVESRLRSTGYTLEWLVTCLSDEQLRSEPVTRAVKYVVSGLNRVHAQRSADFTSSRAIQGRMHAIRALVAYDTRVFQPFEETAPETEESESEDKTASLVAPKR